MGTSVTVGIVLGLIGYALLRATMRARFNAGSRGPREGPTSTGIEAQFAVVVAALLVGQVLPIWHLVLPHAPTPLGVGVVAFAVFIDAGILTALTERPSSVT